MFSLLGEFLEVTKGKLSQRAAEVSSYIFHLVILASCLNAHGAAPVVTSSRICDVKRTTEQYLMLTFQ